MFGSALSEKLDTVFRRLTGLGKLSERNIQDAAKEVQYALLEADVHFSIVKKFTDRVREKAMGSAVLSSVSPGQMFIKIVHDELVGLLGGTETVWNPGNRLPHKVLLTGLQGSGKTTTAGKLGNYLLKKYRYSVLFASGDVYRPAAGRQLRILGEQLKSETILPESGESMRDFVLRVRAEFTTRGNDVLIFDTAGRLEIDRQMMDELTLTAATLVPDSTFLVLDAMTGQQAVAVTKTFSATVPVTGAVLSKLDSDARGGAALSFREITAMPIYFYGSGEKIDDLEIFYPARLASRLLGMGDVVSLVEKAQDTMDEQTARKLQKKLKRQEFDFQDFLDQIQQIQKMGSLQDLLQYIPGFAKLPAGALQFSGNEFDRTRAIIQSMTAAERGQPDLINGARRRRIAAGSGTQVSEVNQLLKQYEMMKKMLQMANKGGIDFKSFGKFK